jgi:hypothetical protein
MKTTWQRLSILVLTALLSVTSFAGPTGTPTISFQVTAINELSVSGNPAALIVNSATAGLAPNSVYDASTSYAITTNETNRKITGSINADMPVNIGLAIILLEPTGATSMGWMVLSTAPVNLVTGIGKLNQSGMLIGYWLAATSAAGVVPSNTRTVTLTITAG